MTSNQHSTPHEIAREYAHSAFVMDVEDKSGMYAHPDSVLGRQIRLARWALGLEEQQQSALDTAYQWQEEAIRLAEQLGSAREEIRYLRTHLETCPQADLLEQLEATQRELERRTMKTREARVTELEEQNESLLRDNETLGVLNETLKEQLEAAQELAATGRESIRMLALREKDYADTLEQFEAFREALEQIAGGKYYAYNIAGNALAQVSERATSATVNDPAAHRGETAGERQGRQPAPASSPAKERDA